MVLGLAGPSGSGKTYSALELAAGLSGDKPFAVIDTENGRALHYADMYRFDHADFKEPYRPKRYADLIIDADAQGYPVIVVDQASHEHSGPGGILDWHDEELDAMVKRSKLNKPEWQLRDIYNMKAWIAPKTSHKHDFVAQLLRTTAHLVFCFRAEEKIKIGKDSKGKTVIEPADFRSATPQYAAGVRGWAPICEKSIVFEMTMSLLFLADNPGVPIPIKLQEQHRQFVSLKDKIDRKAGEALGKWALGSDQPVAEPAREEPPPEEQGVNERPDILGALLDAPDMESLNALAKTIPEMDLGPHTKEQARKVFQQRRAELSGQQ